MQIAMETFFLPEFPDFCRKNSGKKFYATGPWSLHGIGYMNYIETCTKIDFFFCDGRAIIDL